MKPWIEARNKNRYMKYHSKLTYQLSMWAEKWTIMQEASGSSMAPNAARRISYQAWNTPVDYPQV